MTNQQLAMEIVAAAKHQQWSVERLDREIRGLQILSRKEEITLLENYQGK